MITARGCATSRATAIYLTAAVLGNLGWEAAQLPLYTIWENGSRREILVALFHCAAGDALITVATLAFAGLVARLCGWPFLGVRMAALTILLGLGYTIFSEWVNLEIRRSWAYTASMPVLPWIGTGATPILQWLIVPSLALAVARRAIPALGRRGM